MTLAARPLAPLQSVHPLVASYVRGWARATHSDSGNGGHELATWRAHHATFTRLAEGDWGVAVPLYIAPPEIEDGEYSIEVQRRDGTLVPDVRVRPLFALHRGGHGIEICEIAERGADQRGRNRRRARRHDRDR